MLNVLIAEAEELETGGYDVIGVTGSELEARELATFDMRRRLKALDAGEDPGFPPEVYKMYSRTQNGYECVLEIKATELP